MMQVVIDSDGEQHAFGVEHFPVNVLEIKQEICRRSGIPVHDQNLFEYPDAPDQGPGLRLYADHHVFSDATVARVSFVLAIGKVPSWAYFYVSYPCADGQQVVAKFSCHRFTTVAQLKGRISAQLQGHMQADKFLLTHDARIPGLADDVNVFHAGVQNGTQLCCVYNGPPLKE